MAERLLAELEAKPSYAQFRIIGIEDGGREILRIDHSGPNGAIRLVPDAELQRKGERPYFRDTISKGANEIYVSALDLNQENGVIETPHVPTLRIGTPLLGPDGKPFGIVIVNVDMRPALDRVRSSVRQGEAIYVVNGRGDYLVHPRSRARIRLAAGHPDRLAGATSPYLAASLGNDTGHGAHIVPDQAGQPGGAALAPAILAGSEWVAVIETVPNAVVMAPAAAIQNTSILVGLIAVLCAAVLGAADRAIADPADRPIDRGGSGRRPARPAVIPVDAGGETGVLARAFAQVMGEANAKTVALEREVQEHRRTDRGARPPCGARAPVQRRGRIIQRRHHHDVARRHDHRLEFGRRTPVRIYRGGSGRQKSSISSCPPTGWPRCRTSCAGSAGAKASSTMKPSACARTAARSRFRSAYPRSRPRRAIIGASKTARDITENKRTQQALRQQTEELRRIFETSQDLILVMDSKGSWFRSARVAKPSWAMGKTK